MDENNIFIIHQKDGHYQDSNGRNYDNLNDFIDINDKVEHCVEDLETARESAMSRIEFKIEHYPLTWMGLEMNYELTLNLGLLIGSIVVAYM